MNILGFIFKPKIPRIKCSCGKTTKPKRNIAVFICDCGARHRLCRAGKPIRIGGVGITMINDGTTHKGGKYGTD